MLLLTNGYFTHFFFSWIPDNFMGDYTDFTNDWYITVGPQLVNTMLIAAFMPYITFLISFIIKYTSRKIDSCCG